MIGFATTDSISYDIRFNIGKFFCRLLSIAGITLCLGFSLVYVAYQNNQMVIALHKLQDQNRGLQVVHEQLLLEYGALNSSARVKAKALSYGMVMPKQQDIQVVAESL